MHELVIFSHNGKASASMRELCDYMNLSRHATVHKADSMQSQCENASAGRRNRVVFNYGSNCEFMRTATPQWLMNLENECRRYYLNFRKLKKWEFKDVFLQAFSGVSVPWTVTPSKAQDWVNEGHTVFARTLLNSSGGQGIITISEELENKGLIGNLGIKLYTKYIPKKYEYRAHFFVDPDGDIDIWWQQKKRRLSANAADVDYKIRNHENGWVFCTQDISVPLACKEVAQTVAKRTGLDFGAIDIIYNEAQDKAYALECNSAPGMTGRTVEFYANQINRWRSFSGVRTVSSDNSNTHHVNA